jgi:hypothetical protein
VAYLGKLKSEQTALDTQIMEMIVYSEGAVSLTESWMMSADQRNLFIKTMNKYNALKSGKQQNELL